VKSFFRRLTPAAEVGDIVNILAAAWELYYDSNLWKGILPESERIPTLNELVLKSIEIVEFEERTKNTNDPEI
jgi:hypothetical protein